MIGKGIRVWAASFKVFFISEFFEFIIYPVVVISISLELIDENIHLRLSSVFLPLMDFMIAFICTLNVPHLAYT